MRWKNWIELIIILSLHVLVFGAQLRYENYFTPHSYAPLQASENLENEGLFYCGDLDEINNSYYTHCTPGYPLILNLRYMFNDGIWIILLLQSLLSFTSLLIMRRLFKLDKPLNWMLLIFLAFLPSQFITAVQISPEIIAQFCIMLAMLFLAAYIRNGTLRVLFGYQLFIILAILVLPALSSLIIPNILLFIILYLRSRQRLVIISSLLPLVFLIIMSGINQQRTGHFHLSTSNLHSLVEEKIETSYGQQYGEDEAALFVDSIYSHCAGEKELDAWSKCIKKSSFSYIKANLSPFLKSSLKGMLHFWIDPGSFFIKNENGSSKVEFTLAESAKSQHFAKKKMIPEGAFRLRAYLFIVLFINVLRFFGFMAFLFNKGMHSELRLSIVILVLTIMITAGPAGAALSMVPALLLVSGAALYQYGYWFSNILQRKKSTIQDQES